MSDSKIFTVVSWGVGVQSSTMLLLAKHRKITPMPDCAIFSDTGWERRVTYEYLEYLKPLLPFPVYIVGKGNIRDDQVTARVRGKKDDKGGRWAALPYFTKGPEDLREGRVRRQCTSEYKIYPIERKIKDLLGIKPRQRMPKDVVVEQWRGISTDEASRMKPSLHKWMRVRYPLAMELRMSRQDCLNWMRRHGYKEPPRSACIGCPFHSNREWAEIKKDPKEWADVVDFDNHIRDAGGMIRKTYLHRSCKPLAEIDFEVDSGGQMDWVNECEGMCGL